MIELKNVTKIYENGGAKTVALSNVNLKVYDGEFLSIVGKSGSGKSTLLHILGGMTTVTSGTYKFNDIEVSGLSENKLHEFRKDNVGFVFQQFALIDRYTVYENIEMPLLARGVQRKNRKELITRYLNDLGIEKLKNKNVNLLSGGEQQRVAIARALVTNNDLILADEPTGALDSENGKEVLNILKRINRNGKTVIIITHDDEIAGMTDRKIIIEDGCVQVAKPHGNVAGTGAENSRAD